MSAPLNIDTSTIHFDKSDHNPADAKAMLDKVKGMYKQISDASCTGCGCQQQRKIDALHHQVIQAQKTQKSAGAKLSKAEEDYYVASRGAKWYSKYQEEEAKDQASQTTAQILKDFNETKTEVKRNISYLNSQVAYEKKS